MSAPVITDAITIHAETLDEPVAWARLTYYRADGSAVEVVEVPVGATSDLPVPEVASA
jgi:hypothetical protein